MAHLGWTRCREENLTSDHDHDRVDCIHDLARPIEVLTTMRQLSGDHGMVMVMDEKVADDFGAVGDDVERLLYGFSNLVCLPDGMARQGSAGTGAVMRIETLRAYARAAGFTEVEVLPIEADLGRFYRLRHAS